MRFYGEVELSILIINSIFKSPFNLHITLCSSPSKTLANISTWCFCNTASPSVPNENRMMPLSPAPLMNCSRSVESGLGGFTVKGPTNFVAVVSNNRHLLIKVCSVKVILMLKM